MFRAPTTAKKTIMTPKNKLSLLAFESVRSALPDSKLLEDAGYSLVWEGIKISIKARGLSGKQGEKAYSFSHFARKDCVYVLVAIESPYRFWVIAGDKIDTDSLYCSLSDSIGFDGLQEAIRLHAGKETLLYANGDKLG